jgi:hypothetical protein
MSDSSSLKPRPEPLPNTAQGFLAQRVLKKRQTLNDQVEVVHLALAEDERYLDYLSAVWDAHAVEGSLAADNIMAATMIRDKAKKMDNLVLAREKLAIIAKCLGIVMRRYEESRTQRRNTVDGQNVPSENNRHFTDSDN